MDFNNIKYTDLEIVAIVQDRNTKETITKATLKFDQSDTGYDGAPIDWLVGHFLMQARSIVQVVARTALIKIGLISK